MKFLFIPAALAGAFFLNPHPGVPKPHSAQTALQAAASRTASNTPLPAAAKSATAPEFKNYRIIYGADLQKLVNDVHEAMLQNWEVAGGVSVYVQDGKPRYAQAMIGR